MSRRGERARPLTLQLGRRAVTFSTPEDFEFSLSSRTELPAGKVGELTTLSLGELERQAIQIRRLEKRFAEILTGAFTGTGRLGALLAETDPKMFSQDHDWRTIMESLREAGPEHEAYRRIALAKYMQYLGSRLEILKGIYVEKKNPAPESEAFPEPQGTPEPDLRETGIFEVTRLRNTRGSEAVGRLPRGESITLTLTEGSAMEIRLARHPFTLEPSEPPVLRDHEGKRFELHTGINVVGRQAGNDVVIDGNLRDVSRKHLIIEALEDHRVRLTDLSSHGTFIPARHLPA